jgi:hypothetical protein
MHLYFVGFAYATLVMSPVLFFTLAARELNWGRQ